MSTSRSRVSPCLFLFLLASAAAAQNQQVTLGTAKDNTLYFDANGALSNGAGSRMFCGNTALITSGVTRRAVLAFDVAAAIPKRSTIVSVTLRLNMAQGSLAAQAVTMHTVLASWGEGTSVALSGQGGGAPATPGDATWIHRSFATQNWLAAGGDFTATPSASTTVTGVGPYTWATNPQLVAEVQQWLDSPATNHGWMLRTIETGMNTAKAFETKESLVPANRPQLVVVYTPPAAATAPFGPGCAGGGPSPLTLGATGLPRVPEATFALSLGGGPAVGPRALFFATALPPAPIPIGGGCFLNVDPASILVGITVTPPTIPLPVPNDPSLLGADLRLQAAAVDVTTFALATSNALTLSFGI